MAYSKWREIRSANATSKRQAKQIAQNRKGSKNSNKRKHGR